MDESIDDYIAELDATFRRVSEARSRNVRTTDYTVIRFDQTRRDRLWQMKLDQQMVDSVLVCPEDGHREFVHMEMIHELDQDMVPFYEMSTSMTDEGLNLYQVDGTISSALLKSIVYFAYKRACELTEQLSMSLARITDEFGIYSLLDYCMAYLHEHFNDGIAVPCLELAFYSSHELKQFFQNHVEDHFDELWLTYQPDFMKLTYETLAQLLSSDWLNVESESTLWHVIQAWIGYDTENRLSRMPSFIKDVLRFGRIPSSFNIQQSIVSSSLFQLQPIQARQELSEFITRLLDEAFRTAKPIDGNDLCYDESVYNYRPRNPSEFLVLAGGINLRVNPGWTDTIELYDYQLNQWRSSRVILPVKMFEFDTHTIGSNMYIVGGQKQDSFNRDVFSLDLAQAQPNWVTVTPMRTPRKEATSVVYRGKLVVIGGLNDDNEEMVDCEQYDPCSRVWTPFAPLNYARAYAAAAVVHNERIYIACGEDQDDDDVTEEIEIYNPQSDQWQLAAPLNIGRCQFNLFIYLDQVMAVGGVMHGNTVESYNPSTNSWTTETPWLRINPEIFHGAQLNRELVVTDSHGRLYTITNLGPNARVVQLSPGPERYDYSLAVVSSRLAVAFHKP